MPRSIPTPVGPSLAGTLVVPTAPDVLGDIVPSGNVLLVVECGATPTVVTVETTATDTGLDIEDAGGPVAANAIRVFGPFPKRLFAQLSDAAVGPNQVLVDYSSVVTVTRYLIAY